MSDKAILLDSMVMGSSANLVLSHLPGCGITCMFGCPVSALDEQSGIKQEKEYFNIASKRLASEE